METPAELVQERVQVGAWTLTVLRPREPDALIDDEAFERDEFLPYWAELWPSSIVLARTVARRALAGARVLELGCGLGVPSIVAALRGAHALATDWSPEALAFTRENAARNGTAVATAFAAWSDPERLAELGPWELVLASDLLYENRNVPLLLELLPVLVDQGGAVLVADPGRPAATDFLAAVRYAWNVDAVDGDDDHPRVAVYELRRR